MHEIAAADYDTALAHAEHDLGVLAERLDEGARDDPASRSLLALGIRGRTLFRGFVHLISSGVAEAALSLMRPMIEVNLTLRFLVAYPELHTELWLAEGDRQAAILVREVEADTDLLAKTGEPLVGPEWHEEKQRVIADARAKALTAGVAGVGANETGSLMPSLRTIAYTHGDLATREAYTFAYRGLSPAIHVSSRAFDHGAFRQTEEGRVAFSELTAPRQQIRRHRALNATTFASSLCVLSVPLELDVLDDAAMIKSVIMNLVVRETDQ